VQNGYRHLSQQDYFLPAFADADGPCPCRMLARNKVSHRMESTARKENQNATFDSPHFFPFLRTPLGMSAFYWLHLMDAPWTAGHQKCRTTSPARDSGDFVRAIHIKSRRTFHRTGKQL
jgi:hypothetical protein